MEGSHWTHSETSRAHQAWIQGVNVRTQDWGLCYRMCSNRKLGDLLVVMYSVPYSHDFHSNWCAVGIFKKGDTSDHYNTMYYNAEHGFKRKDFYGNVDPVVYEDSDYTVTANMGTSHKPEIQVTVDRIQI